MLKIIKLLTFTIILSTFIATPTFKRPHPIYATFIAHGTLFPKMVFNTIITYCKIPPALPTNLLVPYLNRNSHLVIRLTASLHQYGMELFKNQNSVHQPQYFMADFIGDSESVTNLKSLNIPSDFNTRRFQAHETIKLSSKVMANKYQNRSNFETAIMWSDHHWRYLSDGIGTLYERGVVGMAKEIVNYVSQHGNPVLHASHGNVQALWAGNQPDFRVTWTYNNRQWYSISMATLSGTLQTAHTVILYNQNRNRAKLR